MLKVYLYARCSTCKNATKWLKKYSIDFEELPIVDQPPSREELLQMLEAYEGNIRRLFNTSGIDYRALGLKDKLPELTQDEALDLLLGNGKLVKRPFLISDKFKAVGFRIPEWEKGLF